jgi:hypothetical protein
MFNAFIWILKLYILVDRVTSFSSSFTSFSQFKLTPKRLLTHKLDSFKTVKFLANTDFVCVEAVDHKDINKHGTWLHPVK